MWASPAEYSTYAANDNVKDLEFLDIRTLEIKNETHYEEAAMLLRLVTDQPIRVERSRSYNLVRFYFKDTAEADRFVELFLATPIPEECHD